MKLTQLRYFLEICRHNNVTKAANALHITQPSVSVAIKDLENEFGVDLFLRINKKLILTPEGEVFRDNAEKLLQMADQIVSDMKEMGNFQRAIRLGVPPIIGFMLFPHIFSSFKEKYADINIEVFEYGSEQTLDMIESGEIDVAIAIIDPLKEGAYAVQTFKTTEVCFYTSSSNPLAKYEQIDIAVLNKEPIVMYSENIYINQVIREVFAKAEITPNIILETDQNSTIYNIVFNRIASAFVLREFYIDNDLTTTIPLHPSLPIEIGLIWKKDSRLHPNTRSFIEFIEQQNI